MLIQNVYDTLISFDREEVGSYVPSIATDWIIDQPPHPDAPEGTVSTWYFIIRGTGGSTTFHNLALVPPVECSNWTATWYGLPMTWHLKQWRDNDDSGDLSTSDQVLMRRLEHLGAGEPYVNQWFHVDSINQPTGAPSEIDMVCTEKPVHFQDSSTQTAADVEYSFERAMVQDRSGGPVWMLNEPLIGNGWPDKTDWPEAAGNPIDTAVESNSTHVWFNLAMPYPPFLQILSQTWASIVSQAYCTSIGDWSGDWSNWKSFADPEMSPLDAAGNVMMGTGPYMLDYWTHGVEWSIVKFDDYWEGWPAPHCSRYLDRATVKVVYNGGATILVIGESVGTGDGTKTTFYLDYSPVQIGSETVYLNGVPRPPQQYTIDYATGTITFNKAPRQGVAVTADYTYLASTGRYADFIGGYADAVYIPRAHLPQMILNWPTKWMPGMPTNPEIYAPGIRCLPGIPTLAMDALFFTLDVSPATGYCGTQNFPTGIPLDFFSDVRIRQAFAYGFDYQEFLDTMFWGEAVQPRSCVPEGILYHNPDNPVYTQDFEMARNLFMEASADTESPAHTVWDQGFTMTITYNTGNVPRETTAEMLRDGVQYVFSNYGGGPVTINVLGVPWPTYLGELVGYPLFKSLMPIFVIGWLADFADPHNWAVPYMHTYGDFSRFQSYSNPYVDELIAEGIATPDADPRRQEIYYELQQIYFDDCPSVGTSQALGRHWERDWVQGWYYNPIRGACATARPDGYSGLYFYHIWKGLTGDIDGDNEVGDLDAAKINAHLCIPGVIEGPLGYDPIADVGPVLQYPTPGVISIVDAGVVSAHYREYVP